MQAWEDFEQFYSKLTDFTGRSAAEGVLRVKITMTMIVIFIAFDQTTLGLRFNGLTCSAILKLKQFVGGKETRHRITHLVDVFFMLRFVLEANDIGTWKRDINSQKTAIKYDA